MNRKTRKKKKTKSKIKKKTTWKKEKGRSKGSPGHSGEGPEVTNGVGGRIQPPPRDAIERACSMKEELLSRIEKLGDDLPPNTLDQLIDDLGGPENVAEVR